MPPQAAKGSHKRPAKASDPLLKSEGKKKCRGLGDFDPEGDLSNDIQGLLAAIHQFKEKAQKDGQKKNEETIVSVASEIRAMIDDAKTKMKKERQNFLKTLLKNSKECECSLKNEYSKFQAAYENFCKEKTAHVQTFKDIFSKFEDEKAKVFARYEQQRKKEKIALAELEKVCADKIASAEESLKKKKMDEKSFSILRKSLDAFLEAGSDDDFGPEE